jgi:hypothetical protein
MAVTWNSSDASTNISLSGGNLTATTTSSTQGGIRCNTSVLSGKYYLEVSFGATAPTASAIAFGWANSTAALGSYFGINKNSVANLLNQSSGGQVWLNNISLGTGAGPGSKYCVCCVAFDISNSLMWARLGGKGWNGSSTANPGSGTGGYSVSTLNAGPYFPCFCANQSGVSATANFGATPFTFPVPSGFGSLDTGGAGYSSFEASTKFGGVGVLGTPQDAAGATKVNGLGILGTPQNAAGATKVLGYAVIAPWKPKPFFHGFP